MKGNVMSQYIKLIIVVIITWTGEKFQLQNEHYITGIRVADSSNGLNLFQISSMMSQFSTNKRTLCVLCCCSTIIENRKQQNKDNAVSLVENCDIMLEIWNKLSHLNEPATLIPVM